MTNMVSVVIPPELRERARNCGVNVSEVARVALYIAVSKKEQELTEKAKVAAHVRETYEPL